MTAVDLDNASHQSEDQQNDDNPALIGYTEGNFTPDDDESVNDILQHSLVELTETLRTLETNDPSKAMRLLLPVIPVQSPESLMVFQSLLMMLSNPKEAPTSAPWQQYLMDSIRNQSCSEVELCRVFQRNFKCDEKDHLKVILLDYNHQFAYLNLLMIPKTVTILSLRHIKLKAISDWSGLKGKSLKVLRVDRNPDLKLNLNGLIGELDHLPLDYLVVSKGVVTNYFREQNWERALSKIGDWMRTSTLTSLRLRVRSGPDSRRNVCFNSDGCWKIEGRNETVF